MVANEIAVTVSKLDFPITKHRQQHHLGQLEIRIGLWNLQGHYDDLSKHCSDRFSFTNDPTSQVSHHFLKH